MDDFHTTTQGFPNFSLVSQLLSVLSSYPKQFLLMNTRTYQDFQGISRKSQVIKSRQSNIQNPHQCKKFAKFDRRERQCLQRLNVLKILRRPQNLFAEIHVDIRGPRWSGMIMNGRYKCVRGCKIASLINVK